MEAMKTFTREGRRICYADEGCGPAFYLVHGTNADHSSYDAQVRVVVAAGYRAVVPDRVGRGRSDLGATRFSSQSEAADGWALLDHLGIERAVLMGHSSGAGVIRQMYLDSPERVVGLVSIDSVAFGKLTDFAEAEMRPGACIDSGLSPRFDAQTAALYHKNKATLQRLGRLWDHPSDLNTGFLVEREERRRRNKETWAALPPGPPRSASPPLSGKWCRAPLLVFTAGRGRIGPEDPESEALAGSLPAEDATLVVVKNSGHWMHHEAPEVFNRALLAFLDRLRCDSWPTP